MSTLLFLARDFIERLSNPVYGPAVNEDYGMQLATLLAAEGFEHRLNEEIRSLDDSTAFTSHGWLWVLGWARSKDIELRRDLLKTLFEHSSSVFVRTAILDVAVNEGATGFDRELADVDKFPNRFLADVMTSCVQARDRPRSERRTTELPHKEERSERLPATNAAELTLVSLLQAGKPITLSAASTLLRHTWEGQDQLNEFFKRLTEVLDEETRREWLTRLGLLRFESGL
jgi:hypothetical protein